MIETKDLVIAKGKQEDWKDMYENVWSHEEAARYMYWNVTTDEKEAERRMARTLDFEKDHDAFLVYEKKSGRAIGFAGVEQMQEGVCEEIGICVGPEFFRHGYGKQILAALMEYAREKCGCRRFIYTSREENVASMALARSMGFAYLDERMQKDERDGSEARLIRFYRDL